MKRSKCHLLYFAAVILLCINNHVQAQAQNQHQAIDSQNPLVYGLIVDNSGSLRSNWHEVIEAGKLIVNSHKMGDEVFIVSFVDSENIKVVQDFTSNKAALIDSLERMYVKGGSSAIVDAVYFSLQHISQGRGVNSSAIRRVLILITDGDERQSFYKLEQLLKLVRETGVRVYAIGFITALKQDIGITTKKKATNFLNRIADESGGRAFFPETMAEGRNIASCILDDIRKQQ